MLLIGVVFCCAFKAHCAIYIPDSAKQTIQAEINFIEKEIENFQGDSLQQVKLKCYLSKLYNKAGQYERARIIIDQISPTSFHFAKGDISLAKAINFKYQLQPEQAKLFFDRAIYEFTLKNDHCKLIETHVELIEYYRKFDLFDLALKQCEIVENLLKKHKGCNPLLSIRYLNRLAAIQNMRDLNLCIQTSYSCIDSCLKYNEKYYLAVSYNEIGYAYQHIFELDSADYYFQQSENLFRSQGLIADAIHVKMNRIRMYAHNRMNVDQIIDGLIEIETEAIQNVPTYDLFECYNSIWVEAESNKDWETAFKYMRKFYYLDRVKWESNVAQQIEKVKQQEKESQTKIQNFILSSQVNAQKNELEQTKTIFWLVLIALIILLAIMIFLFRILRQRDKLTKDLALRNSQKDELIQEVHHRVKNNLSFVSSLLEMQINSLPEESKTDELKNASLRIESMSLVHQMLYTQDEIGTVDLAVYIPELFSHLKETLIHENDLKTEMECQSVKVEPRTATAFGLIITEFVTNSFKHAFEGVSNPTIKVDLHRLKNDLVLILKDNGVGMKNQSTQKRGFGMRVIDIFSRQINASVQFSYESGTQLTLIMKYEE